MANNIKTFDPLSNFNKAIKTLEKNNIRTTKQRMVLAKLLFEKGRRHISAEELYDEVKKDDRKISLATIYNTLHSFVEKKILKLVSVKEGKAIFCTNMKNHYHFFNPKTGKLTDIPFQKIQIKKLPKPPKGTKIDNIEITINLNTKN